MNIDNLKTVIGFGISLGNGLGNMFSEPEADFDLNDAFNLLPLLVGIPNVLDSFPEAKSELLDLDDEEKQALIEWVDEEFDLPQDNLEQRIEDAVELAFHVVRYVLTWIPKSDEG